MKKFLLSSLLLFFVAYYSFSQSVGIGTATPNTSAALDITSPIKGLLIPRMNMPGILAIISPAKGLIVYDSAANQLMVNTGNAALPNWQPVASGSGNAWNLSGNSGTNPANQFIGNIDNQPLRFRVNNIAAGELHPNGNIFWGLRAGQINTTGFSNIAIGTDALKLNLSNFNLLAIGDSALFNNTSGIFNTAVGSKSLFANIEGNGNTAIGYQSLSSNVSGFSNTSVGNLSLVSNRGGNNNTSIGNQSLEKNTTGNLNTAIGNRTLNSNTVGIENVAIGSFALFSNTNGFSNTAIGMNALLGNTSGVENTAVGNRSLFGNTTATGNTAVGSRSLLSNTTGAANSAVGSNSLSSNTTGAANTAVGNNSLQSNTSGSNNTALANNALGNNTTGVENTALGWSAMNSNTVGSFNVAIGRAALANTSSAQFNTVVGFNAGTGSNLGFNNTLIGSNADVAFFNGLFNCVALGESSTCTASSQVRFGNSSTTSIGGFVGYTQISDGRYKKNIQEAVKGIDFIMKLRPVTYQLDVSGLSSKLNESRGKERNEQAKKTMAEQEQTIFTGFVAQEVEVAAKTVGYDFSGVDKPKNENDMYGLRYAEFVVPLVKAMQEHQTTIKALQLQVEAGKVEIQMQIGKQQQIIDQLKKENADLQKRVVALEKK